jgi:hypothetical protein
MSLRASGCAVYYILCFDDVVLSPARCGTCLVTGLDHRIRLAIGCIMLGLAGRLSQYVVLWHPNFRFAFQPVHECT